MYDNARIAGGWSIVSGVIGFLEVLVIVLTIWYFSDLGKDRQASINTIIGSFLAFLSALAVTGGVFALKKKYWGLALAGAIAGIFTFFPFGVVATIFAAIAKPEFGAGKLPPTPV